MIEELAVVVKIENHQVWVEADKLVRVAVACKKHRVPPTHSVTF